MTTFIRNRSGTWRAQIRRQGLSTSKSLSHKIDAEAWANHVELGLYRGQSPQISTASQVATIANLFDRHNADMAQVGKAVNAGEIWQLLAGEKVQQ